MTDSKNHDMNKTPDFPPTNALTGNRYQMRHAAGIYWLLDMEQSGMPYVKPLPMNEMGATIWNMRRRGLDLDKIAEKLSDSYEIPVEQAREDVGLFLAELQRQGVLV
ncbi:MAG: PqqD family protein [Lachnospiraceae bacterium]|nr:PqqD family protein [Lachnospiraceae bacterium]